MKWSKYQEDCFKWIESAIRRKDKNPCLVIEAVAGSGKTTVLKEMVRRTIHAIADNRCENMSILSAAFGKINAKDLRKAIDSIGNASNNEVVRNLSKEVHTKTLHSLSCTTMLKALGKNISRNGGYDGGLVLGVTDSGFNWKIQHLILGSNKRGVSPVVFEMQNFDPQKYAMDLISLISKVKSHGLVPSYAVNERGQQARIKWSMGTVNEEIIKELVDIYTLERFYDVPVEILTHWVNNILKASIAQARHEIIDFDDMIYIPTIFGHPYKKYDMVMIDESQDISHVQRRIIHCLRNRKGSILIAVGDSAQAIYAFRGAASNSMDLFREEFNAEDLDLPVCYRCPKSIQELVVPTVPKFEVFEQNIEGSVVEVEKFDSENLKPLANRTMIICRNNAPLLSTAYNLLANSVPVSILGINLLSDLNGLIDAATEKRVVPVEMFDGMLQHYLAEKQAKAQENGYRINMSKLDDMRECLNIIIENNPSIKTTLDIKNAIKSLMCNKTGVKLATIHKAKGMESDSVFIIRSDEEGQRYIPSKYAITPEQIKQESNLEYVAITRAKKRLFFVPKNVFVLDTEK